ncbi:hypothetical protein AOLI_G00219050 [Acnodon oligacanthus]
MTEEARGEEGHRDSAARSQRWRVGRALTAGLRQRCSGAEELQDVPSIPLPSFSEGHPQLEEPPADHFLPVG